MIQFTNEELLEIAYAVKLSMPNKENKENILSNITKSIETEGSHKEKVDLNTFLNIPDAPGENWHQDLEKHREFYHSNQLH